MVNNCQNIDDLRIPSSNRMEKLQGSDFYGIKKYPMAECFTLEKQPKL